MAGINDNNDNMDVTMTVTPAVIPQAIPFDASAGISTGNGSNETTRRALFGAGLHPLTVPNEPGHVIPSMPSSASQGLMPDKFDGKSFKTWQQKMLFFLTTLSCEKYLQEDRHVVPPGNTDAYTLATVEAWIHGDYVCKGQILGRLVDPLYEIYCHAKSSKALWMALEKKYKTDDAGLQRFSTAKFLNFSMVDSKPIMEQVEALQRICQEIELEGMSICGIFTVNSFIEKLPPSWTNFKNYLTFKRKALSLEELVWRLQIEANNRAAHGNGTQI